jgi:hypothetical protein
MFYYYNANINKEKEKIMIKKHPKSGIIALCTIFCTAQYAGNQIFEASIQFVNKNNTVIVDIPKEHFSQNNNIQVSSLIQVVLQLIQDHPKELIDLMSHFQIRLKPGTRLSDGTILQNHMIIFDSNNGPQNTNVDVHVPQNNNIVQMDVISLQ